MSQGQSAGLNPLKIMETGLGFWASKTVLSAAELGVFTELAQGPLKGEELGKRLGLHPRGRRDFLDALVALGMLRREGNVYSNTPETDLFMDRNKPTYVGGLLEMCNARLYGFWGSLTTALKTGKAQNESARGGENVFEALYADPARLKQFLQSMTGISLGAATAIAEKFPWKQYKSFADVGCAQGAVPATVARTHGHLNGIGFDLPVVGPIFEEYVKSFGLEKRVKFRGGDFLKGEMPRADVLVMGHILHDWDQDQKKMLLSKAHAALPEGGALIVYEAIIDDERKSNAFGLLMSLNMLIETTGGFDYTGADCCGWMKEVGFKQARVEHLVGPDSMVVGVK